MYVVCYREATRHCCHLASWHPPTIPPTLLAFGDPSEKQLETASMQSQHRSKRPTSHRRWHTRLPQDFPAAGRSRIISAQGCSGSARWGREQSKPLHVCMNIPVQAIGSMPLASGCTAGRQQRQARDSKAACPVEQEALERAAGKRNTPIGCVSEGGPGRVHVAMFRLSQVWWHTKQGSSMAILASTPERLSKCSCGTSPSASLAHMSTSRSL